MSPHARSGETESLQDDTVELTKPPSACLYSDTIIGQAPRVLSMMDRERHSPTVGCCDRTHWAWKFTDFPGARFQESVCALAFLYSTPLPGSPFRGNQRLLEWIEWGLRYWCRIQYSDGSFDEAYPRERSLAATAFTSFYVAEALGFLGSDLADECRETVIESLARAGQWLTKNDETHGVLSNHLAAASAALFHVYLLSSESRFRTRSAHFLDRVLAHQSEEGWYEEYGGADPGYQTHGSFYLVRLYQLDPSERLRVSLASAMRFLAHFVHPDGSLGGEYASRNTKTYYPAAFEMWRSENANASWIAERMRNSVASSKTVGGPSVGVYNYFPMLNNLVFAFCALRDSDTPAPESEEPSPTPGLVWFPQAGIARRRTPHLDVYVGTAKGGVVLVFDRLKKALVLRDCGYVGKLGRRRVIASQYQDRGRPVEVAEDHIVVEGRFCEVTKPTLTPVRFLGFRVFSLTAGRIPALAHWLKRLLVRVLIHKRRELGIRFKRTIEINDRDVHVIDEITRNGGPSVQTLWWEPTFTTIHMGSSRYFVDSDLQSATALQLDPNQLDAGIALDRSVEAEP